MQNIPGYGDINVEELEDISIINGIGIINTGYKLVNQNKDKSGLITVLDYKNNRILRVHPSRIDKSNSHGSISVKISENNVVAACPKCENILNIPNESERCYCTHCDYYFDIINKMTKKEPKKIKTKDKPAKVNIDDLANIGELWIKNVEFDHKNVDVKAICIRIDDRYLSFNLYNNTYGKSNTLPPIDDLTSNNDNPKIYKITNHEKWVAKMVKKGYSKYA